MLSDTLADGLKEYGIGAKIRLLRQRKKLGLVQLGEHTGLSAAMLSKIERGQLFPTLPTLLRIALVFGVGLEHFFAADEGPKATVVRKKDRLRLPDKPGRKLPSYFFESLDFPVSDRKLEAYYAEFPAGAEPSEPHRHDGPEIIYVTKGQLGVNVDGREHTLEEGDAMCLESQVPHSYGCVGQSTSAAMVVVATDSP